MPSAPIRFTERGDFMKVVCVAGPTATGKTRLGVYLAEKLNGEVISCDSMQIYRGMDVGTAKVTQEEMRGIKHHMIDVAEPGEDFSVAAYVLMATPIVEDVISRGKTPIVVGGTGLYMDSLIRGTDFADNGSGQVRRELEKIAREQGGEKLLEMLREVDGETAETLHPNNVKRIVRALEVYRLTGETISEHDRRTKERPDRFEAVRIVLSYADRQKLYDRIDSRVDVMLENGLENEVRGLLHALPENSTAMAAIGYKEMAEYLRGECTLSEAAEKIKLLSRRYAKRQVTWFKRNGDAKWLFVDEYPDFSHVEKLAEQFVRENI